MNACHPEATGNGDAQVVPLPRATDGIGAALRASWGGGGVLPTEWLRLLHRLDQAR